eukprot:4406488-Amphidinium_carterae.1
MEDSRCWSFHCRFTNIHLQIHGDVHYEGWCASTCKQFPMLSFLPRRDQSSSATTVRQTSLVTRFCCFVAV